MPPSHWSCIVSPAICSVIFVGTAFSTPCDVVPHFPGPAFSSPAIWSVIFQVLHCPGPAFSVAPTRRLPKLTGALNPSKRRRRRLQQVEKSQGPYSGTSIDHLGAIYTDPRAPGSFSGVRNLQRFGCRSEREVKKFLSARDAYTLHKPRRIRFLRRRTYSKGIADLYQIDLVDVSSLSPFNDGMRYLLSCIDVFS